MTVVGTALMVVLSVTASTDYVRTRVIDNSNDVSCLTWKGGSKLVLSQNGLGLSTVAGDGEFSAVRASIDTWNAAASACSSLRLAEGPRSASRVVGYKEDGSPNENLVLFRTKSCNQVAPANDPCVADLSCGNKYDCWEGDADTVAVTLTTYDKTTGRLADADIEFNAAAGRNGRQFFFTVADAPACAAASPSSNCVSTDIQNTATHELGHLLGLAHSSALTSVMFKSAPLGETSKRSLDTSSKQFLCDAYPATGPAVDCIVRAANKEGFPAHGCDGTGAGTLGWPLALAWLIHKKRSWRQS
jgi:Matrixin